MTNNQKTIQHKRRILIVSFKDQIKIISFGLFLNTLIFWILHFISHKCMNLFFQQSQAHIRAEYLENYQESYQAVMTYLNEAFLIFFIVCTIGLLATSILLSHRLIGPIYKMTRLLREFNEKPNHPPPQIHLRKGDFFLELAQELNKLLSKIGKS